MKSGIDRFGVREIRTIVKNDTIINKEFCKMRNRSPARDNTLPICLKIIASDIDVASLRLLRLAPYTLIYVLRG